MPSRAPENSATELDRKHKMAQEHFPCRWHSLYPNAKCESRAAVLLQKDTSWAFMPTTCAHRANELLLGKGTQELLQAW